MAIYHLVQTSFSVLTTLNGHTDITVYVAPLPEPGRFNKEHSQLGVSRSRSRQELVSHRVSSSLCSNTWAVYTSTIKCIGWEFPSL